MKETVNRISKCRTYLKELNFKDKRCVIHEGTHINHTFSKFLNHKNISLLIFESINQVMTKLLEAIS